MKRNEKKMARSQLRLMFSVYEKRCFSCAWYRGMANAAPYSVAHAVHCSLKHLGIVEHYVLRYGEERERCYEQ